MSPLPANSAPDRPGTPRWVKIVYVLVAVIAVLVVLALLLGGGHGPGRHQSWAHDGGRAVPSPALPERAPDHAVTQPC